MPARQRLVDIGTARGRSVLLDLCREAEIARLDHDLSYAAIGRSLGIDRKQVARIFRGQSPALSIIRAAQVLALVGLELGARAYPAGTPLRDNAQLALVRRVRALLPPSLRWRSEVPVIELSGSLDLRAWDGAIDGTGLEVRVEAETALRDVQAVLRRMTLKQRDGAVDRLILAVSDTRRNRSVISTASHDLRSVFPCSARSALAALRAGRAPTGNALLLL